jgi:hypothetical protein
VIFDPVNGLALAMTQIRSLKMVIWPISVQPVPSLGSIFQMAGRTILISEPIPLNPLQ